jgi:hypothetical protein
LATAFPRCVRGCPYLTAGVERVGHIYWDAEWFELQNPCPIPSLSTGIDRVQERGVAAARSS